MFYRYIKLLRSKNILNELIVNYSLSSSKIRTILKPFYLLVHPDLFAFYPNAQHNNDINLKLLMNHLDLLQSNTKPSSIKLCFYVKNVDDGDLEIRKLYLHDDSVKSALRSILRSFKLSTVYIDELQAQHYKRSLSFKVHYYDPQDADMHNTKQGDDDLHSWLTKNVPKVEKRLAKSKPIRNDIEKMKNELRNDLNLSDLTWVRGIGTTHLRGCLQGLKALAEDHHSLISKYLKGRHVHFGNETGISLNGSIILSTSEVRDQWKKLISNVEELDFKISRIPYMQKTVSNTLRDITVTRRKYQTLFMAEAYTDNLRRLVTSLCDFSSRRGFPAHWPQSLSHLQLVVESASAPLMLSPSGQIITPSSCPPGLLVDFISEHMDGASKLIDSYRSLRIKEKDLHRECVREFSLLFLDKDDSVSPLAMNDCLRHLLSHSHSLSPLLAHSRLWVTQYYSVMIDGEICIPCDWYRIE